MIIFYQFLAIVQKTMHQVVILISLNTLQELELRYQENIANTSPYNSYHFGARAKHLYRSHTNIFLRNAGHWSTPSN